MPFVKVTWYSGRTKEQRMQVAKGITEVMQSIGVPASATQVVFEDVPKDYWASGGELASEAQAKPASDGKK